MMLPADSALAKQPPDKIFGVGIGRFLHELGVPLQFAVTFGMLAFATFVYDTLDVATRLARYLFTEFTGWRTRMGGIVGTVTSLGLPFWFVAQTAKDASGKVIPAYQVIWPLFGSTNQLLAGLTLTGLVLWLAKTGKPKLLQWLVAIPMVFMMGMTASALVLQIGSAPNKVMLSVGIVLLVLAAWITFEALASVIGRGRAKAA
jgi:carbon starvation protein